MGSIVLLDELTINQIAAGEVIERPANVVKELIENSIDAGATKINVEIENGGISLIRITDNGKGIASDDVEIAFERHATSKIRSSKDLMKISTMGFRGEALASIASVGKVELVTKTADSSIGTRIIVEGGDIVLKEECGAPQGTTITVKELFYNTPVRYKFLKKDYTEAGYIETALERIALINPNISFKLLSNKKQVLQTSGNGDIQTVVFNLFGKDISQNIVKVNFEYEGIKVSGVVGKPEIARSNRANQMFYVNNRYIKDKTLSAATEEAYRTLIPQGKFGFCVLNVTLNPELVDVNVHPAKLEVRFTDESSVFKAVYHGVRNALLGNDLIADSSADNRPVARENTVAAPAKKGLFEIFKGSASHFASVTSNDDNVITANFENHLSKNESGDSLSNFSNSITDTVSINEESAKYNTENESATHVMQNYVEIDQDIPSIAETSSEKKAPVFYEQDFIEKAELPEYKILGVAFNTYIILQLEDDIYILDQHAAHERVLYEKVKKNFYKDGGNEIQMLLLPDVLNLSKKDMRMVHNNMRLFEQSGFDIEEFGEDAIKINGVPVICYDMNTKDLFLDILDGLDITNRTNKQDIEEKFIATVACKAAVKGNMYLDESEIRSLLDELLQLESPFTCPHGRPTAIRITRNEIEKKFGRR
ncbi:MAG: DNA mismatch repair endonuclease MutL [Clostridia bacterium]|nr:DNA mismatch repair endonuclease MutL [Clostridia bacterium]